MIEVDILDDIAKGVENDIMAAIQKGTSDGLMALALNAQADAQRSILKGPKTGKLYKRGDTMHRASADGEAPANDLSFLVASIKAEETDANTVDLKADAPYAMALEFGTYDMAARPYLGPAGDKARRQGPEVIDAYVKAALK
ncbi:hypothetical protein EDE12_11230 [Methylosinus sp. sav-2]|uniref:hypothetical protein n=1 Tax=Methylosinus sp. sav-2 TaxID=2485168 RepID=UPI00055EA005|nr:hypothetical protein [Methylosinus sp. sav-2]TDX61929.1 hypothetical protein EDE12_11230 [Methylosinus sp. sav-2]